MTIYQAIKKIAETVRRAGRAAGQGQEAARHRQGKVDNGTEDVPSVLLDPIAVTKDNIKDTIIKDGFHKAARDLHGRVREACADAGIQTG